MPTPGTHATPSPYPRAQNGQPVPDGHQVQQPPDYAYPPPPANYSGGDDQPTGQLPPASESRADARRRKEAKAAAAQTPWVVASARDAAAVLGRFYAMCLDTFVQMFRRPFQLREFVEQAWFIAKVSFVPTLLVAIPFCVIIVFQTNQLLGELGAVDLSGAGAGLAVVREIGPMVSVLVVAGSGATAICADLGARTIREEIDAMVTLGVNPIQRLVVPRVLASTVVALALNGLVTIFGLAGGFIFSVYVQHASAGLFVSNVTLLVGLFDFLTSEFKAAVFGLLAGLVACFMGLHVKGGPKGVGDAVNQTVVFSFMMLFFANSVITAVFLQIKGGS